jgi:uncharacterized protein (TIGR02996 family)
MAMSVWFSYRCHYDLPAARFVKRFEEGTILEWFRKYCRPIADADEASAYAKQLFGFEPYGFGYFLTRLAEEHVPPPRNNRELYRALDYWSVQGEWICSPHAIQGLDDDDEQEMAFYLFDDIFDSKYPERVAWLTCEDWRLPGNAGAGSFQPEFALTGLKPEGQWEGAVYLVFLVNDGCELSDLDRGAYRLDGVRLPQLTRWLTRVSEEERDKCDWCGTLRDLADEILADDPKSEPAEKAFLHDLRGNPHDDTVWEVYGDWLEEQGRHRAEMWLLERALARIGRRPIHRHPADEVPENTPNLSQWLVRPHVAQLCLHESTVYRHNCFDHWVLFDDLWASAHPDLANSLLRQLERWDVLSSPHRSRYE